MNAKTLALKTLTTSAVLTAALAGTTGVAFAEDIAPAPQADPARRPGQGRPGAPADQAPGRPRQGRSGAAADQAPGRPQGHRPGAPAEGPEGS